MVKNITVLLWVCLCTSELLFGQTYPNIQGVFPHMTVKSRNLDASRSETGIGALLPWADKLWVISYVAHIQGAGIGLYEVDEHLNFRLHPESYTGTYANRMVHQPSNQGIIGPHIITAKGKVTTLDIIKDHRLAACMDHLETPDSMVYFLTMEGLLFETNVYTYESRQLFDLVAELNIPQGAKSHFKGGYTGAGRVVVANNTYHEEEYTRERSAGRLAEWDGKEWTIISENPFVEVSGKHGWGEGEYGDPIYALGWDQSSVLFKLYAGGSWKTYRLPKFSQAYDHAWNTEWMRIRAAQTERYLVDIHGLMYELPSTIYEGKLNGLKPICSHLRIIPDFCYWQGMFVLAGDQVDATQGQPQSGLWFGNIDDLWNWGKPTGFGGPWYKTDVKADVPSDPFIMMGFDQKILHLTHDSDNPVTLTIEVDFMGRDEWHVYHEITLEPDKPYLPYIFPDGFHAQWVRLKVNQSINMTAFFVYQ